MRLFFTILCRKTALVPTILAHLGCLRKGCTDSRPAEGIGLLGLEDGGERGGMYVAVCVGVLLVVAAGEEVAVGGEDAACPQAIAGRDPREALPQSAERMAFQAVSAVSALLVATLSAARGHQRVAVSVVVELCGLAREAVGAEAAVSLAEQSALKRIGAEQETLQFNNGIVARNQALAAGCLPLLMQVAQGILHLLHASALPIGFVGRLRKPVHRDDDTVQSAHHQPFSHRAVEGLRVGGDDGVATLLRRLAYHLGQTRVEQRLALEIELDGVGMAETLGEQGERIVGERDVRRAACALADVLFRSADGALGAGELADVGRLDGEESGIVRNMHYAEEA